MKNLKNTEIFTIDPTDIIQQELIKFQDVTKRSLF